MNIHSKPYEYGIVASLLLAVIGAVAGTLLLSLSNDLYTPGIALWTLAVVAAAIALTLSFPLPYLRRVGAKTTGGTRYERLRRWNRIKISSILLNLLLILGVVVLGTAVLSRMDVLNVTLDTLGVHRALAILMLGITGVATYAHHQALRMDLRPDRSATMRGITFTALQAAAAIAALGAYVSTRSEPIHILFILRSGDAPILLLVATLIVGVITMTARGLPTLYVLVSDERSTYLGRDYISRQKSVVMPTLIAFTLLFVFLLLMVVFGAGALGAVQQVTSNRPLLLLLVIMVLAAVAGLAMSLVIARQEDRVTLYRHRSPRQQREELIIIGVSIALAVGFGIAATLLFQGTNIFGLPRSRWLDLASAALMGAVGPYGFYAARNSRRIRDMEQRFPDFLRDLASSHKGGLTLVQSVHVAARGDYSALTPEIKKMADQLSWNIGFEEAFRRFGDRVNTPLAQRTVSIVLEAGRSGGNTTDVLLAAARDARELKTLERERRLSMSVYTTVIYVTFFVFLFVIGVLFSRFVPQILEAGAASAESSLGDVGLSLQGVTLDQYRTFYFTASAVQAIGNGMMAGMMGSGKSSLGLKHAFLMLLFTYIAFAFVMAV